MWSRRLFRPRPTGSRPIRRRSRVRSNERWRGVPFVLSAGKALDRRLAEIRVLFKPAPWQIFCNADGCPDSNELVVRIQHNAAVFFTITNKVPGVGLALASKSLDMTYRAAFTEKIPSAYESLLLDVVDGNKDLFVSRQELDAAWDLFTPVLDEIESSDVAPLPYAFGSQGPSLPPT